MVFQLGINKVYFQSDQAKLGFFPSSLASAWKKKPHLHDFTQWAGKLVFYNASEDTSLTKPSNLQDWVDAVGAGFPSLRTLIACFGRALYKLAVAPWHATWHTTHNWHPPENRKKRKKSYISSGCVHHTSLRCQRGWEPITNQRPHEGSIRLVVKKKKHLVNI